ncbi:hypothetical protein BDY21DRAFT_341369 [Lineolata rhizophorae]|uniref:Uncharacterized protein n=1 Tax=Lineolata rhizophorae TaxID=578093 RepID=A0A6A6P436_9PEZI|nr:hypothetical protein BDY21DRAFT_341369 [Lineolata rhizophorae]
MYTPPAQPSTAIRTSGEQSPLPPRAPPQASCPAGRPHKHTRNVYRAQTQARKARAPQQLDGTLYLCRQRR